MREGVKEGGLLKEKESGQSLTEIRGKRKRANISWHQKEKDGNPGFLISGFRPESGSLGFMIPADQIQFQSWKSLRRSAVSSVTAPRSNSEL